MSQYRRHAALQGYAISEPTSSEVDLSRIVRLVEIIRCYESLVEFLLVAGSPQHQSPPQVAFPCIAHDEEHKWRKWMAEAAVEVAGGNKRGASALLGFPSSHTLYYWLGSKRPPSYFKRGRNSSPLPVATAALEPTDPPVHHPPHPPPHQPVPGNDDSYSTEKEEPGNV